MSHWPTQHSLPDAVPLKYTIASSSPHSGKYVPENIMFDKPQDTSSRWSGAFQGNANQWIILRLDSLAILKTITFGKFSKPHPCNIKELKIFVGVSEDHMTEVLHTNLKNDITPEAFHLRHVNNSGVQFPTRYVKILPLLAHGQNFHISIWHVSMTGIIDPSYVENVHLAYEEFRETSVLCYVLKHLRQRRLLTPYQAILSRANVHLEHPLVTQLHEGIVLQGNWKESEQLLEQMSSTGLFDDYLQSCQPQSIWTRLTGTDADGDVPSARGGHAMCIDPINEIIYAFGGWNGEKSLDDFWVYSVKEDKWRVLSHSTTQERNAPGARSCHKMIFDTKTGCIYVLGRLHEADGLREPGPSPVQGTTSGSQPQQSAGSSSDDGNPGPAPKSFESEFYRYHTRGILSGTWDFLSFDTAASGGPPLIFDHQMAMDSEAQILYVFGGRIIDGDWNSWKYSGLYSYNVSTSKWKTLLQRDDSASQEKIPSRLGHSMILDPSSKTLFIFAGMREEKFLPDMHSYNIETGITTEIFSNFSAVGGPDACFTQRAVIDPALKEFYVFCGLTRHSSARNNTLRADLSNWVYRYESRPGKWIQILQQSDRPPSELPLPRFAHQVVYNPRTKTIFMHGGNAGCYPQIDRLKVSNEDGDVAAEHDTSKEKEVTVKEKRLDDFWRMELNRPGPAEIIRQGKFAIRRQQFREMCEEAPAVKALSFLQTQVFNVVDHSNAKETESFRSLLTYLLSPSSSPSSTRDAGEKDSCATTCSSSSTSRSSFVEHEDTRESSSRPWKRSRAERESNGSSGGESGVWTSEVTLRDDSSASSIFVSGEIKRLKEMVDPMEAIIRGDDGAESSSSSNALTGTRYSQRTEVFESILKFVADSERQPEDSLLDLVEKDRSWMEHT